MREDVCDRYGMDCREVSTIEEAIADLDVLYMTRVQKERFLDEDEYDRVKDCFVLTADKLRDAKAAMRILHPLPRVNEIATDVDADPRAAYFRQVENGKFVRMALMLKLLEWADMAEKTADWSPREQSAESIGAPTAVAFPTRKMWSRFSDLLPTATVCRCLYCESKPERE